MVNEDAALSDSPYEGGDVARPEQQVVEEPVQQQSVEVMQPQVNQQMPPQGMMPPQQEMATPPIGMPMQPPMAQPAMPAMRYGGHYQGGGEDLSAYQDTTEPSSGLLCPPCKGAWLHI